MEPYDIEQAFAAVEDELIESMIRNMKRHHGEEISENKQWTMWQAEQLKALEKYKKENREKFGSWFSDINGQIEDVIKEANRKGYMEQEVEILEAIRNGFEEYEKASKTMQAEFFRLNERKLEALIQATTKDMEKAETAILRMADDQYRRTIFNAQVYANSGAGTYEKAVDMATKDMVASGLNCVQYKNGSRHTLKDYADMALRTASKRAYLQGEGVKRQEWGIATVIVNKRGNPCPKCLPFCGKIMIDDVWSGGSAKGRSSVTGLKYPLMSEAVAAGLYHPRCRDSHTTYFEGVSTSPSKKYTKKELKRIADDYREEQKAQYAKKQEEKYRRLEQNSLDEENQKIYAARREEWKRRQVKPSEVPSEYAERVLTVTDKYFKKSVVKPGNSDIIKLYRRGRDARKGLKFINDETFNNLTISARKNGAVIMRGTKEVEEHLDKMGAAALNLGDVLMFRKDVCVSEVLEETYHFEQNLKKINIDKEQRLRTILNEIDAKRYLLDNSQKYRIPRKEIELTEKQLRSYEKQLEEYYRRENG